MERWNQLVSDEKTKKNVSPRPASDRRRAMEETERGTHSGTVEGIYRITRDTNENVSS